MTGSTVSEVPKTRLSPSELCSRLAVRGLPTWLLECLSTGLAKRAAPDRKRSSEVSEVDQDSLLGHDSISCEDLAKMGIAHPLHQRRLLREIGIMFGNLEIDEETRKKSDVKKEIPALPKKTQVKEAKNLTPTVDNKSELNHARRRYLLAESLNNVAMTDLPQEVRELLSKRGSLSHAPMKRKTRSHFIPEIIDLPRMRAASEPLAESERMCDVDFEATEPGWDEWLQGRLHSWGPLALISTLLSVAKNGDLTELSEMTDTVKSHGAALLESLKCTPLPADRFMPNAPVGTDQPKDVWTWVCWRQEILEDAECELNELLQKADEIIAAISNNSKKKHAKVDKRKTMRLLPPTSTSRNRKRSANLRAAAFVTCPGKLSHSKSRDLPICASGEAPTTSKSSTRVRGSIRFADAVTDDQDASAGAGRTRRPDLLAKFRKAAFSVLAHVKSANGNDVLLNTNLLSCITLQGRVRNVSRDIQETQNRLGQWPGLMGEAHESCRAKLVSLKQASEQLFQRFVDIRKPMEEKLRMLTAGDQGVVDRTELEAKILAVQRELAARVLIGNQAWKIAHDAGVGIAQFGFDEAPDPWGGEMHPSPPPWEATFIKAVKRFEPLRRGLEMRRKAQTPACILGKIKSLKQLGSYDEDLSGFRRQDSHEF
eukprot:TRINITY_DN10817_c0_g1_i2.p1 TRINITY_DN10817_c0_g1~~TRINITY_DN10817_c0_g1_i2.p1  ORF type:complete len:655 (-),score=105.54 TRINITY_DN10817_c0_g1_i2:245-2209(-)